MLKLRFSKPSVKTYNDGKITVCKYDCTLFDNCTKEIIDTFTVTGTSKCAPTDIVWDDYGRKLADSRAKLAAYRIAENIIDRECVECITEEIERNMKLLKFVNTMNYLKRQEVDHINYLKEELDE